MDYVMGTYSDYTQPLALAHSKELEKIVKKLHLKGFVLGDLRHPNVVIDFDWVGCFDKEEVSMADEDIPSDILASLIATRSQPQGISSLFYPIGISKLVFMSAIRAEDLEPIRPEHDWRMFNRIKKGIAA